VLNKLLSNILLHAESMMCVVYNTMRKERPKREVVAEITTQSKLILSITGVTEACTVWGGVDAVQFCGGGPFLGW
jgi:hypothetical protein